MFKQRLLTTIILVPLLLWGLYFAPFWLLQLTLLTLMLLCGYEWSKLIPLPNLLWHIAYLISLLVLLVVCDWLLKYWLILSLIAWCGIIFAILTYPRTVNLWGKIEVVAGLGLILLPLWAVSLKYIYLQQDGKNLTLLLLMMVWASDIGAYIFGKLFGKNKLIPRVSPGKTIEGLVGGIILTMLITLFGFIVGLYHSSIFFWLLFSILVAVISVVGDLFVSMLKRRCQVKDTGNIFPGHGGALDRLDSLIAATPLFLSSIYFMS